MVLLLELCLNDWKTQDLIPDLLMKGLMFFPFQQQEQTPKRSWMEQQCHDQALEREAGDEGAGPGSATLSVILGNSYSFELWQPPLYNKELALTIKVSLFPQHQAEYQP